MLQRNGAYWSILGRTGAYGDALGHTWTYWGVFGCTGVYWGILERTGAYWSVLGKRIASIYEQTLAVQHSKPLRDKVMALGDRMICDTTSE